MKRFLLFLLTVSVWAQLPDAYPRSIYHDTAANITASNCTVGQVAFATDATAGQNLYLCTATNTWTQVSGGGSGLSAVQAITITLNASQVTNLFTSPQVVLAAQGAGKVIRPLDVFLNFVYAGALFSCGSHDFGLGYTSSMVNAQYAMPSTFATTFAENTAIEFTAAQSILPLAAGVVATGPNYINSAVYFGSQTANCTGGAGATIVVTMLYTVTSGVS
jgi:hypothetical protein